jgi:hypothetical protein
MMFASISASISTSLSTSLLLATACSAAYADRSIAGPAPPPAHIALSIAPARVRAPYDVQIMRGDGELLPTYALGGRFYVQGSANDRYVIRITNPTERRIEAVVSVDGLDVIDGENGDVRKRGYVVPAYGETRIEGFRTSHADVATFRFSSVSGSYAGQKGKARNVGVIAVALFEEQADEPEQQIILGQAPPPPRHHHRPYDYRDDIDDERSAAGSAESGPGVRNAAKADADSGGARDRAPASRRAETKAADAPGARPAAPQATAPRGGYAPPSEDEAGDDLAMPMPHPRPQRERLGLGTEFGEQRYSAASYTRFVRAAGRPAAIAELRYNDTAGLMALGIAIQPLPDSREIMLRETADPFPGDRFARPPR